MNNHIDKGSYSEAYAASLVRMMTMAVRNCHSRGVIHRDVKPENFLWTGEDGTGTLKLADFGPAAIQEDGVRLSCPASPITSTGIPSAALCLKGGPSHHGAAV